MPSVPATILILLAAIGFGFMMNSAYHSDRIVNVAKVNCERQGGTLVASLYNNHPICISPAAIIK